MQRFRIHPAVLLVALAACTLAASRGGADHGSYRHWASALANGEIFLLPSAVASPMGLPLTHWSPGPGMLFALPQMLLGVVVDFVSSPLVAGWMTTLLLGWATYRIMAWAASGNVDLEVLGLGAAFLGTHSGFLSHHHASESIAVTLVALLTLSLIEPDRRLAVSSWWVGCCSALLLMTRAHYIVYALPALGMAFLRIAGLGGRWLLATGETAGGDRIAATPTPARQRLASAFLLVLPLSLALVQQALVNRWMTGSITATPYVYGDASFRSVSWSDPLFLPVLGHSWHGLLTYHPLYAVAFAAAVVCWRRATASPERWLWAGGLAAVVANLWIQAAWYAWWMGIGTFGMRGMAPAAVVLTPALVRVLQTAPSSRPGIVRLTAASRGWIVAVVVCCLWSYLLLRQGVTQFYTFAQLWEGQATTLAALGERRAMLALLAAAFLVVGVWRWLQQQATRGTGDLWAHGAAVALGALSAAYLFESTRPRWASVAPELVLPAVLLLVAFGSTFMALRVAGEAWRANRAGAPPSSGRSPTRRSPRPSDEGLVGPFARFAVTVWFAACCALFGRLALTTELRLAAGSLPDRDFQYRASFDVQAAQTALREYERIDGFDDRKEALRRFLESHDDR